jgi:hypothetical protein
MFNGLVVYGGGAALVEEVRFARSSRYLSSWWRRLSEGFILKLFADYILNCMKSDWLVKVVDCLPQVTSLLERENR